MSSNWKKLSAELKASAPKHNSKHSSQKRPRDADSARPNEPSKKRKLPSSDSQTKDTVEPRKLDLDDIWFDDVKKEDIIAAYGGQLEEKLGNGKGKLTAEGGNQEKLEKIGKYVAMDCEMVGVGDEGTRSVLARVSIVNYFGHTLLDRYVKPVEYVSDFRTHVSGIRKYHLKEAISLKEVQKEVAEILQGRIVVGHGLENDFEVLMLSHPRKMIRDTAKYKPFKKEFAKGRTPGLRKLAKAMLGMEIQDGEHSSVEDAKAAMMIYRHRRDEWEASLKVKGAGGVGKKDGEKK